jgi:hypothetical protein
MTMTRARSIAISFFIIHSPSCNFAQSDGSDYAFYCQYYMKKMGLSTISEKDFLKKSG